MEIINVVLVESVEMMLYLLEKEHCANVWNKTTGDGIAFSLWGGKLAWVSFIKGLLIDWLEVFIVIAIRVIILAAANVYFGVSCWWLKFIIDGRPCVVVLYFMWSTWLWRKFCRLVNRKCFLETYWTTYFLRFPINERERDWTRLSVVSIMTWHKKDFNSEL